ncbi:D-alanyl-D-alanine carboxypeptidase [Actinomadura harenae]|uniref:D-alanyl-D-alanine carboxypeptidase n=2 Tax=Actinomadura harenae TaxID=2483351 RepID=A0A3M2LSM3_9ACTN|nr:D-alanyl-D-alanine carboxypeptidase [Actinomadura harenae]
MLLIGAVFTGLLAVGVAFALGQGPVPGGRGAEPGDRLGLPWPGTGQGAVEIEGLGGPVTGGEQKRVAIASVTKVMTAYVVLRDHPLRAGEDGPSITIDRTASRESGNRDESTVFLGEGQRFSQRRMLQLMLLPSANNVARLLARWDAGSEKAFVAKMNAAAARLGMRDTVYTGASGYEASTVSTAVDQLALARVAMGEPALAAVVAAREATVPGVGVVRNTNRLLDEPDVVGLKTGSSTPAGGALMWAARVGAGDRARLVLGVVLRQGGAGTSLDGKLEAAFDGSRRLLGAVRRLVTARTAAEAATPFQAAGPRS